jgi:hypothetical protein
MTLGLNQPQMEVVAGRTESLVWDAKIVGVDGKTQEAMAPSDHVRWKLSATQDGAPLLDLHSSGATVNGSTCTIATRGSATELASGTVKLGQDDTKTLSGIYYWELLLVDMSESAATPALRDKIICRGTIKFIDEQQGNLGAP